MEITPVNTITGEITVPSDLAITHRALILAALADGTSTIRHPIQCYDTRATIMALRSMGIEIETSDDTITVHGKGLHGLKRPEVPIHVQGSATTVRLLTGVLSAQDFTCTVTGDHEILERPMVNLCKPLRQMRARISALGGRECAPLTITGRKLRGIQHVNPTASSQVKSTLLFAGLYASSKTTVYEPVQSRDHTEILLDQFGVPVQCSHMSNSKGKSFGESVTVSPVERLTPCEITVPGDFSSAAFFIAAALCIPGSELTIHDVGINPTRIGFLGVLGVMGAEIYIENEKSINGELRADLLVRYSRLHAVDVPQETVASMIDDVPILAVAATQALGVTTIHQISELRDRATDRVDALITNLAAIGATIHVEDEDLIIAGSPIRGGEMNSYGDHRIAMTCTVVAMLAQGPSILHDTDCVENSCPGFYELMEKICR